MIVSLGEALIDRIHPADGTEPKVLVGGSPYNVAIALGRLEVPAGLVCPLSTDPYGELLTRGLEDDGVAALSPRRVAAPTAVAEVRTDGDGQPRYTFFREGTADRALGACPPIQALPEDLDALHFGSLVLAQASDWPAWREAIVAARERGVTVAFDPNLRPALIDDLDHYRARLPEAVALCDLIKASDEDLTLLAPDQAPEDTLLGWLEGDRVVVLTEGAQGARLWTASGVQVVCRETVEGPIVDTVGAGDTFQAALLAWLWHREALRRPLAEDEAKALLGFATRAAGLNCTRTGCQPPALSELGPPR